MKALLVVGTRPNFMKIAPLYRAMHGSAEFDPVLVDTGQHFDHEMSGAFLEVLQLPEPDYRLQIGPGTQAQQIAAVMTALEPVLEHVGPDVTVVVGDVSSTLAAALASDILSVPVAHVEAGLRSRNWAMPEERNRVLTDRLSKWLFTPSADANDNLAAEGITPQRIHLVGNVMIDSLEWVLPHLDPEKARARHGVSDGPYGLVTLHRPANVDDHLVLGGLVQALREVSEAIPLVFPVHPRTQQRLVQHFGFPEPDEGLGSSRLRLVSPLDYLEFIALLSQASLVLTDSGGIQEEATVLGVPCLTTRNETERPVTLADGANEVVGIEPARIVEAAQRRLAGRKRRASRPPLWDGRSAERIVEVLHGGEPS
ncbi:MAG: non-hydrolyzing UDP-N-acetylglucosamine 2-epimerase [Nitrososphaerales archaeon]